MSDMAARFTEIVGNNNLLTGDAIPEDYGHDEELWRPRNSRRMSPSRGRAEEVAQLLKSASNTACR